MKDKRFRELHHRLGSKDPFSYWYATELLLFRRLFGLKYRPGSAAEADAFWDWLTKKP